MRDAHACLAFKKMDSGGLNHIKSNLQRCLYIAGALCAPRLPDVKPPCSTRRASCPVFFWPNFAPHHSESW